MKETVVKGFKYNLCELGGKLISNSLKYVDKTKIIIFVAEEKNSNLTQESAKIFNQIMNKVTGVAYNYDNLN